MNQIRDTDVLKMLTEQENYNTLQPNFAKSDQRFNRKELLPSAALATDRSGNERAVRLSKQSGYINSGRQPNGSPLRMDNAWIAWSFQCNLVL